jgi:hypothetical protein
MKNPNPGAIAFRARFARRLPLRLEAALAPVAAGFIALAVAVGVPRMAAWASVELAAVVPRASVELLPILWYRLPIPVFRPGRYPPPSWSFVVLVVGLMAIALLWRGEGRRLVAPIRLWLVYVVGLFVVSAAFFLLVPEAFPYTMRDVAILYFEMQVGLWIAVPIVVGAALVPLTYRRGAALLHVVMLVVLEVYSILFGWVRYGVLVAALPWISYLAMAPIFFAFGPLMDFIYVSAFYGLYVGLLAETARRRPDVWRWGYSSSS